jgi:hypothetical protein
MPSSHGQDDIGGLGSVVLANLADLERRGGADPNTQGLALRVRAAAELCSRPDRLPTLHSQLIAAIRGDLIRLKSITSPSTPPTADMLSVAARLGDRVVFTIGSAAAAQLINDRPSDAESDARESVAQVARQYGLDAAGERRAERWLYLLYAVLTLIAITIAVVGLRQAHRDGRFELSEFMAYAAVGLAVAVLSSGLLLPASQHRRQAHEYVRLERQLVGFEAFVTPMPPVLGNLLRGSIAPQLFPRLLESNEPWQVGEWPSPDSVLRALVDESG